MPQVHVSGPDVLHSLRGLLLLRTPLAAADPPVPVYTVDRGSWRDPEAIVLSRLTMAGARWLGWGQGPESFRTVDPLSLGWYAFVTVPGSTPEADKQAWDRLKVLFGEVVQQLRDTPDVGGELAPAVRYQPPRVDTAVWAAWPATQEGTATVRVRVDARIAWQAIS